jgi:hypothetical protein
VNWESCVWVGDGSNTLKGDDSLRSFLFTLRNPHGVPPRKFTLRGEQKRREIVCSSRHGPAFGGCICVCGEGSHTACFGETYNSVSGQRDDYFLTGANTFTVKEIEAFEIAD